MTDSSEEVAQRIAEQGREALLARLRPAFAEAVATHADVLSLNDDQVEAMVQGAADRADGLQWRRALASVASDELGIGLGEALWHPAVERAQVIVGAPSYEDGLAKLGIAPPARAERPRPATSAPHAAPIEAEAVDEPLAAEQGEDSEYPEPAGAPAAAAEAEPAFDPQATAVHDPLTDEDEIVEDEPYPRDDDSEAKEETGMLRLAATHLGGIATLQAGEEGLELRFGEPGLDIARRPGRVLGRLRWREIRELEVTPPRGLRRRRRADRAHLVIRTEHGDATFEVPAVTEDELRANLDPLLARYGAL